MQRRIDVAELPDEHLVVRFDFIDGERGHERFWLELDHGEVDLCSTNPGHETAMVVSTDRRTLTEVWMGHRDFGDALRRRAIRIDGPRRLAQQLPRWLRLSMFATATA